MTGESILVIDDSPTIMKLAQFVLSEEHHRVVSAPDGAAGLQVAQDDPPGVVLLNDTLPDMSAYDFWSAMSAHAVLSKIPVVIMSTNPEQAAKPFGGSGGVTFLAKPFSPPALKSIVAAALPSHQVTPNEVRVETSAPLALVARHVTPAPGAPVFFDNMWLPEGTALIVDLALGPLADVLALLGAQGQTGLLTVVRGQVRVEIFLVSGQVDLARGLGLPAEFLFGRFLIEGGALTTDALAGAIADNDDAQSGALLGVDLVFRGLISEDARRRALAAQTSAIVFEALRWRTGKAAFAAGAPPGEVLDSQARLNVDALVLEGARRVDEWRVMAEEVSDFAVVYVRNEERLAGLGPGKLTRDELTILGLVNGKLSVKELVYQSKMGSFDVTKILYRLVVAKLIRKRAPVVAA